MRKNVVSDLQLHDAIQGCLARRPSSSSSTVVMRYLIIIHLHKRAVEQVNNLRKQVLAGKCHYQVGLIPVFLWSSLPLEWQDSTTPTPGKLLLSPSSPSTTGKRITGEGSQRRISVPRWAFHGQLLTARLWNESSPGWQLFTLLLNSPPRLHILNFSCQCTS